MSFTLYDICIPSFIQTLDSTINVLDKGKAFAEAQGMDLEELTKISLRDDMLPLTFQVISVAHHSLGAVNGIKAGEFAPPPKMPGIDYLGLQNLLIDAKEQIASLSADEINALTGNPLTFKLGSREIPFIVENFIQGFSLPNFYFHATTTYDLLRMQGVDLGKKDFLGDMRASL